MGLFWGLNNDISQESCRNVLKAIQLFVQLNTYDPEGERIWGVHRTSGNLLIWTLRTCGLEWPRKEAPLSAQGFFFFFLSFKYQITGMTSVLLSFTNSFVQSILCPLNTSGIPWRAPSWMSYLSRNRSSHLVSPYFTPLSTLSEWFQ